MSFINLDEQQYSGAPVVTGINTDIVTPTDSYTLKDKISEEKEYELITHPDVDTSEKPQWDKESKVGYIKNYSNKYNMEHSREDLEDQDIPSDVISNLENRDFLKNKPLEGGLIMPGTPAWRLLDKVGIAAVGAAAKVIGGLKDMYRTRGMPQYVVDKIKSGTDEELAHLYKTLQKTEGKQFGDELLTSKDSSMVPENFFEQKRFFRNRIPTIESQLKKQTDELFPGSPELQENISKSVDDLYQFHNKKVKTAYDKVEGMTKNDNKYNLTQMREDLLIKLREDGAPEEVIRRIKRNLFYIERNLSPAERAAQKRLPDLDEAVDNLELDLSLLLPKSKSTNFTKRYEEAIRELKVVPTGKKSHGNQTKITELKKTYDNYIKAYDTKVEVEGILPNFDEVGETEFIRLIKEINRKKYVGGGDIGKYDMEEQAALTKSKKFIENHFEQVTAEKNPGITTAFKEARATYRDKISIFGPQNRGNKNFPQLGKMVDDGYDLGKDIDMNKQINSMLKEPNTIKAIGSKLEEVKPGQTKEIAEEWLHKEIGTIIEGDRRLIDLKRVDINQLSGKLDYLVNDPRKMKFIEETMGKDKVDEIVNLHNMSKSLNTLTKDIAKKEGFKGGEQTAWENIMAGEGKLGLNKVGRSIRMLRDYFTDNGMGGQYSREVMDRSMKYIKRIQDSKTAMQKSMAEQELGKYLEEVTLKGAPIESTASRNTILGMKPSGVTQEWWRD